MKDIEILKNVIDLEYRKLLHEYNATSIALVSVSIGLLGFAYSITKDMLSSLMLVGFSFPVLESQREYVAEKLENKIEEARGLLGSKERKK